MRARTLAGPLAGLVVACGESFTQTNPETVTVKTVPPSATVAPGGVQPFAAQVTGTTFTSVTWTVQEGSPGGAVTAGGVYTAPGLAGTYHVVAASVADVSKSGSSTVTVGVVVTVTPPASPV